MSDETISLNLLLATAALERAGDSRSKVLAVYAGSDLTSNAAITEFHEYVERLVETSPLAARETLVSLRESVRGRLFTLATRGYSSSERARIDRERAGEPGTTYAPFREQTSVLDPAATRETPVAVSCDLGEGPGLGRHTLPVFPPKATSNRDFMRFPFACTRRAHEHVLAYAEIVGAKRGLNDKDLEDLRSWARDFWVVGCHRKLPEAMSAKTLEAIVEITFTHTEWPGHREAWTVELSRARGMLREARERESMIDEHTKGTRQ